ADAVLGGGDRLPAVLTERHAPHEARVPRPRGVMPQCFDVPEVDLAFGVCLVDLAGPGAASPCQDAAPVRRDGESGDMYADGLLRLAHLSRRCIQRVQGPGLCVKPHDLTPVRSEHHLRQLRAGRTRPGVLAPALRQRPDLDLAAGESCGEPATVWGESEGFHAATHFQDAVAAGHSRAPASWPWVQVLLPAAFPV